MRIYFVDYLHFQGILSVIEVMLTWIVESYIIGLPFYHISSSVIRRLSCKNPSEISSNLIYIILRTSWCVSWGYITWKEYKLGIDSLVCVPINIELSSIVMVDLNRWLSSCFWIAISEIPIVPSFSIIPILSGGR